MKDFNELKFVISARDVIDAMLMYSTFYENSDVNANVNRGLLTEIMSLTYDVIVENFECVDGKYTIKKFENHDDLTHWLEDNLANIADVANLARNAYPAATYGPKKILCLNDSDLQYRIMNNIKRYIGIIEGYDRFGTNLILNCVDTIRYVLFKEKVRNIDVPDALKYMKDSVIFISKNCRNTKIKSKIETPRDDEAVEKFISNAIVVPENMIDGCLSNYDFYVTSFADVDEFREWIKNIKYYEIHRRNTAMIYLDDISDTISLPMEICDVIFDKIPENIIVGESRWE